MEEDPALPCLDPRKGFPSVNPNALHTNLFGLDPSRSDLQNGKNTIGSKSFKDALSGKSSSADLKVDLVHTSFKGMPAIMCSDQNIECLAEPFAFSLVGKFTLRRPKIDDIRKFFFNLKLSGSFTVGLLDARHILIKLSNDLDYSRVFARRSYYVNNCQMRLLKWTPYFDIREESPITPVWISLPDIRVHFINHHVLFAIGNIFGRPLQVDQATADKSRPNVARILVELDVTKNYPKEIWIGSENYGYAQKIELEKLPIFCSHCKTHGHLFKDCFIAHPWLRKKPAPANLNVDLSKDVDNDSFKKSDSDILPDDMLGNAVFPVSASPVRDSDVNPGEVLGIDNKLAPYVDLELVTSCVNENKDLDSPVGVGVNPSLDKFVSKDGGDVIALDCQPISNNILNSPVQKDLSNGPGIENVTLNVSLEGDVGVIPSDVLQDCVLNSAGSVLPVLPEIHDAIELVSFEEGEFRRPSNLGDSSTYYEGDGSDYDKGFQVVSKKKKKFNKQVSFLPRATRSKASSSSFNV